MCSTFDTWIYFLYFRPIITRNSKSKKNKYFSVNFILFRFLDCFYHFRCVSIIFRTGTITKFRRFDAKESRNIFFPYVIGVAFGFGWTPCIGPILGSILALASIEETLSRAVVLLISYSSGLAIPFVLSGYLIQRFLLFSKNIKKNINLISKIGGITLLITGILILTNQLQVIGFYIIKIVPFMQNFG